MNILTRLLALLIDFACLLPCIFILMAFEWAAPALFTPRVFDVAMSCSLLCIALGGPGMWKMG
jgi:hypothetical protein